MSTRRVTPDKQRMTNHYVKRPPGEGARAQTAANARMAEAFADLETAWCGLREQRDEDAQQADS